MDTVIQLFKNILEISLFASAMIVIVLLIKKFARDRVNIKVVSFLWFLVILRLCLPGMLESPVHVDGLFPELSKAQEAIEQPIAQNDTLNYGQNYALSSSQIQNHDTVSPTKNVASNDTANNAPKTIPFYEEALNFIKSIDLWLAAAILWMTGGAIVLVLALKESIAFGFRIRKSSHPLTDQAILDIIAKHQRANHLT